MNKGTVDTQQRRFQLSRTPNNTFPLTISGRATQVGIASFSWAWVSDGESKGENRRRTFTQILLLCCFERDLFLLITVDWHFSLCCSSMLILFFLFLLSPRICRIPPQTFPVGCKVCQSCCWLFFHAIEAVFKRSASAKDWLTQHLCRCCQFW